MSGASHNNADPEGNLSSSPQFFDRPPPSPFEDRPSLEDVSPIRSKLLNFDKGEDRKFWSEPSKKGSFPLRSAAIALGILLTICVIGVLNSDTYGVSIFSSTSPGSNYDTLPKPNTFIGSQRDFIFTDGTQWTRPEGLKIVGIVFFGRRQFVDVLECYLRRNLRVNGGMLDEVHFLMHTDIEADKRWLRRLVKNQGLEEHFKLKAEDTDGNWSLWKSFSNLYKNFMTDPDTIYIKIDDDILFVDDMAIPELVLTTLEHPEAYAVVANNINNKWSLWHHHRAGVIWPYMGASENDSTLWSPNTWRASKLPYYSGELPEKMHDFTRDYDPPAKGHRWLPVEPTESKAEAIAHTPWGPWLPNPMYHNGKESTGWAVTAQAHYSFFENLEKNLLDRYAFGSGDDRLWNLWYTRWNINFIAIRGSHVTLKPFWPPHRVSNVKGDEKLLTITIPRELDMPVLVATRSITAHYSFRGDREDLEQTDILDRYRALANQYVCGASNQKGRWGKKLGPHHTLDEKILNHDSEEDDDDDLGDGPTDIINEGDDGDDEDEDDSSVTVRT